MADFSIVRAACRGFGGLFDARGRDDRMQFWIYCALVFAPLIVVQMVAQVVLTFPPLDMLVKAEPNDPQFAQRLFQYQMQGAAKAAFLNIGLFLLGAALLLTATARRLHDRGRSGWWACVLPPAILVITHSQARRTAAMVEHLPAQLAEMSRGATVDPTELMTWAARASAGPDWAAIGCGFVLLLLFVELVRAGTDDSNRFGAPPD